MARIRARSHIIHILFVQLILLIFVKADNSTYYNNITVNNHSIRSDRSKRSPSDNDPEKFEAMIKNEFGQFIHLQWMKAPQTLANEHLPIWTAHLNNYGTYHQNHPDLSHTVGNLVPYHDLEQNSAVLYDRVEKTLWGSIGTKYQITGLQINLLHQCLSIREPHLRISQYVSHRLTDNIEPARDVIARFENCYDRSPFHNIPSSSRNPYFPENYVFETNGRKVNKRDIDLIHRNTTKIRKPREVPEHFYVEIILLVYNSIVLHHKNLRGNNYLSEVVKYHLMYFNSIDMLYAKLRTNDLHIHINLAGIIIEDDPGAIDFVIDYQKYVRNSQLGELYHTQFLRYLDYYDLPFEKDSVDMIFATTGHQVMSEYYDGTFGGLTWDKINRYRTRQVYKRMDNVPLTVAMFTDHVYEYCVGAHEIGHA